MTKTLTEQWREGTIDCSHHYYVRIKGKEEMGRGGIDFIDIIRPPLFIDQYDKLMKYNDPEVLAPVPSYQQLYGPNDGRIPVGLFTVLKLIKRDIERTQEYRHLTDLECGIKSQVVSLLKRRGWDLGKDGLVSNSDELVQKIHILNEQNIKRYNELCEEIKKNNILEKKLDIATKALKEYANCKPTEWMTCVTADKALKEMEGVK